VRLGESMNRVIDVPRLGIGEGSIDPDERIARGEITHDEVADFVEALQGDELYKRIDSELIPEQCVDGRDEITRGPNAAGGTFSLVMGDALTFNTFCKIGDKAATHAKHVYGHLRSIGHRIGGHDDAAAKGATCGCGAEDKLDNSDADKPSILRYISRRSDEIRDALTSLSITATSEPLGIQISDDVHGLITKRSDELQAESYASSGAELRQAFVDIAGEESVATLEGVHNEVVVVINTRAGETLDREKVRQLFGDKIEAFNVDVHALRKGAQSMSNNAEKEADARFIASLYYNVATAAVLSGKSLRIVVR
jgi:hypothetical protein